MVKIVDFPEIVPVAHSRFWLQADASGDRGLDGRETVVYSENRFWRGRIVLPHLTQVQAMHLLACCDDLRGRASVLRMPVTNWGTLTDPGNDAEFWASVGVSDAMAADGFVPFSDSATFSDGSGFALPDRGPGEILVAAGVGADRIRVDGHLGRHLAIGAVFSSHEFLYRTAENDDGRIRFNPPLRKAVSVGELIEVSAPTILCRLADARQMRLDVEYCHYGLPLTFDVVEAFER